MILVNYKLHELLKFLKPDRLVSGQLILDSCYFSYTWNTGLKKYSVDKICLNQPERKKKAAEKKQTLNYGSTFCQIKIQRGTKWFYGPKIQE